MSGLEVELARQAEGARATTAALADDIVELRARRPPTDPQEKERGGDATPVATDAIPRVLTARDVLAAAAVVFDVSVAELTGPVRSHPLVHYRQATVLAVRRLTGASYPALGRLFHRDHTTARQQCARARPDLVAAVVEAATASSSTSLRAEVELLRAEVAELQAVVEGGRSPQRVAPGQLRLLVAG